MSCSIANLVEEATKVLGGSSSTTYRLKGHVRGATELRRYQGGVAHASSQRINEGGTPHPSDTARSMAYLKVNDPSNVYYLNQYFNQNEPPPYSYPHNFCLEFNAKGGSTLTFGIAKEVLTQEPNDVGGGTPEVNDISTINGQFLQIDIVNALIASVTEKRGGIVRGLKWSTFEDNVFGVGSEK